MAEYDHRLANVLAILQSIVEEVKDYPEKKPISSDSYLPPDMVASAQRALAAYGMGVPEARP